MHKKSLVITLALISMLLIVTPAHCIELRATGTLQVLANWLGNNQLGFSSPYQPPDVSRDFHGSQFFQIQLDINPSEAVSITGLFEQDTYWGWDGPGEFEGGAIGTDGVNVQTSLLFMHIHPEGSSYHVRAGLTSVALPNQVGGSIILDDTMGAILSTFKLDHDQHGTVFWARPYDDNPPDNSTNSSADLFGLSYTWAPDDHLLSPYLLFARIGKNVSGDPLGSAWSDGGNIGLWNGFSDFSGTPWGVWVGYSGKYHVGPVVTLKADLMWGTLDGGSSAASRQGALLLGEIDYRFTNFTLSLLGWWGTGDSSSSYKHGAGRMPFVTNQWGLTGFGYYRYVITTTGSLVIQDTTGRWTLGATIDQLNLIDDLITEIQFLYMRGTNSPSIVKNNRFSQELLAGGYRNNWGTYLTTNDWLIEIDTETVYKFTDHISARFRFGYIHIEVDPDVWGTSDTKDGYKAVLMMDYQF